MFFSRTQLLVVDGTCAHQPVTNRMLQIVSHLWVRMFGTNITAPGHGLDFMVVFTKDISRGVGSATDQSASPAKVKSH